MKPARTNLAGWAALAAIALAIAVVSIGYWPGIMIDDARWQYQQAVDNAYEDWHPPLMAWIWRRLMFMHPGPGPMLLLQLALLWGGLALISWWAIRKVQPRLALAVALTAWLPAPLALSGTVTKDCLMAGALMTASGLALTRDLAGTRVQRVALTIASAFFIVFAASLRLNAVFACVPLLLAILPRLLTRTKPRLLASGLVAAIALLAVGPAVNAALQAEDTDVDLSLIIFDLGGITEHSGVSVFPDLGVPDPVKTNQHCYDPMGWDSYSSWAKSPCPLGFVSFQNKKDEDDLSPIRIWLTAIIHHPFSYAEHRLTHFNLATAFLANNRPEFTAWSQSAPNPWGYVVSSRAIIPVLTTLANRSVETPIGWPIFWISVALAAAVAAAMERATPVVIALACSASVYGLSYLFVGVAVGMRYQFWTISGGAVAAVLVIAELMSRTEFPAAESLRIPALIVVVPTLLAILARTSL